MAENGDRETAVDKKTSTRWAIASIMSGGFLGPTVTGFDLVNLQTGRAHSLALLSGGISGPLPVGASFTASNYAAFTTPRPVNFRDFDGRGARLTAVSGLLYSYTWLTIWDGAAYAAQRLAHVSIDGGWGLSIPGGEIAHGVTLLSFGSGDPVGDLDVELTPPNPDRRLEEETSLRGHLKANEEAVWIDVDGDVLFEFNKWDIKREAKGVLNTVGGIIRSNRARRVSIEGHTDAVGTDSYNKWLSRQRADAVKLWLIKNRYVRATDDVETVGYGHDYPKVPDKPSDPDDIRKQNRRVEFVIWKR
jgi:outer membrane protein OmpA-like peptidoglycan-associated protein